MNTRFNKAVGKNVRLNVVDANEGNFQGHGQGFRHSVADQEGTQESGALGGCNRIKVAEGNASLIHRCSNSRNCHKAMRSGCEFWNHSAVLLVHGLSVDHVRQYPLAPKDRRSAVVAAAFDREY